MPAARPSRVRRGSGHLHAPRQRAARWRAAGGRRRQGGTGARRAGADLRGPLRQHRRLAALRLPPGQPPHPGPACARPAAHPRRSRTARDGRRPGRDGDAGAGRLRTGVRGVFRQRAWTRTWRQPGADSPAAENPPAGRRAVTSATSATSLLHLLQFASPALPIGAYSYSQGLETALESGAVHNAETARVWILRHLHEVVARWEAPVCWRLMQAFAARDEAAVALWSERFIASRDSAEFRAETIQMGFSLTKLIAELGIADAAMLALLQREPEVALPTAFACAVDALQIPHDAALLA